MLRQSRCNTDAWLYAKEPSALNTRIRLKVHIILRCSVRTKVGIPKPSSCTAERSQYSKVLTVSIIPTLPLL
jgi:hypothetical protein